VNNLSILVLDDEKRITEELSEFLERKKFNVFEANEVATAFAILKEQNIDILILDIRLNDANGLDVLKDVKLRFPSVEVIMITGHGDMNTVIDSMRLGAIDFLKKPFQHIDVKIAIERTGKFIQMHQELKLAENKNSLISMELENNIEREMVGESKAIKDVLELTLNAAKFKDVNVLISGESGTGKEIIARIIHFASERKKKNFFPVNCSAIPESLLESELFGHMKGSFTGALRDKKGLFELTDGGTLFLDEIADMPLNLQAKLLRVIEDKKIKRIGDISEFSVDVRIVAATNHNVEKLVDEGRFRLDLFHRLNTLIIDIPPLRERPDDIEPLLHHFVHNFSQKINRQAPKIDNQLITYLKKYGFPGNVRELKNLAERALILCKTKVLSKDCFPLKGKTKVAGTVENKNYNLEHNEIELLKAALVKSENNQTKAAELLGISRHALIRRMGRFDIS
jgi:DNA-binding NtrC family response regulator